MLADEIWRQSRERRFALPLFTIDNQINKQAHYQRLESEFRLCWSWPDCASGYSKTLMEETHATQRQRHVG